MAGIWIFSEHRDTLLELIGEARRLADPHSPVTAVTTQRAAAQDALAHGADAATVLVQPEGQPLEACASTLARVLAEGSPDLVLFGATLRARDLAAQVGARLGVALASCATALRLQPDGRVETDRMVYGGGGISRQVMTTRPQLVTVPPRTFPAPAPAARLGEVREVAVPADARVKVTERRARASQAKDIAAAPVVVGVGRGIAKQEDLKAIEGLAAKLGGAVGCTRPVAEDLHWLPEESYIGISGRKIAPQLYLAIGLSGQVQHLAGMRDSKVVVAINKDENAPIFANADVGLVADAQAAVPALVAELAKLGR